MRTSVNGEFCFILTYAASIWQHVVRNNLGVFQNKELNAITVGLYFTSFHRNIVSSKHSRSYTTNPEIVWCEHHSWHQINHQESWWLWCNESAIQTQTTEASCEESVFVVFTWSKLVAASMGKFLNCLVETATFIQKTFSRSIFESKTIHFHLSSPSHQSNLFLISKYFYKNQHLSI